MLKRLRCFSILCIVSVMLVSCDKPLIEPKLNLNSDPELQAELNERVKPQRSYDTFLRGVEMPECTGDCQLVCIKERDYHYWECRLCGKIDQKEEHKPINGGKMNGNQKMLFGYFAIGGKLYYGEKLFCEVCEIRLPSEYNNYYLYSKSLEEFKELYEKNPELFDREENDTNTMRPSH